MEGKQSGHSFFWFLQRNNAVVEPWAPHTGPGAGILVLGVPVRELGQRVLVDGSLERKKRRYWEAQRKNTAVSAAINLSPRSIAEASTQERRSDTVIRLRGRFWGTDEKHAEEGAPQQQQPHRRRAAPPHPPAPKSATPDHKKEKGGAKVSRRRRRGGGGRRKWSRGKQRRRRLVSLALLRFTLHGYRAPRVVWCGVCLWPGPPMERAASARWWNRTKQSHTACTWRPRQAAMMCSNN